MKKNPNQRPIEPPPASQTRPSRNWEDVYRAQTNEIHRLDEVIARLTAENERLIRLVERAYREGYKSGFHEGGGGFNGYLAIDTQPDSDTAWDYSEAAEAIQKIRSGD